MSSRTDDYIISETNKAIAALLESLDGLHGDLTEINPGALADEMLPHVHEFLSKMVISLNQYRLGTLIFATISKKGREE